MMNDKLETIHSARLDNSTGGKDESWSDWGGRWGKDVGGAVGSALGSLTGTSTGTAGGTIVGGLIGERVGSYAGSLVDDTHKYGRDNPLVLPALGT